MSKLITALIALLFWIVGFNLVLFYAGWQITLGVFLLLWSENLHKNLKSE